MTNSKSTNSRKVSRYVCDDLADAVIADYFPDKRKDLQAILNGFNRNDTDFGSEATASLVALRQNINDTIAKYDSDLMIQGRKFFDRYASDNLMLLGFLSLPYCYAAANGSAVLSRSKKILEDPKARLSETALFVFEVMKSGAFDKYGTGLTVILKVRLMHAAVRWYIKNSGDWDVEKLGEPVNQEDMAGTNLAFSLLVIRGLRKLGRQVDSKDAFAYIYYWNAVGEMLGVEPDLLPADNKVAFKLEREIRLSQFAKSESGVKLTKSLVNYLTKETNGTLVEGMVEPIMSFFLGDRVSETVGIDLNYTQKTILKPYRVFLTLKNLLVDEKDSFGKAYLEFKKHSTNSLDDQIFALP